MTELLYYSIPIITECGAAVLSCEKDERSGAYKIILDRTMIYPEGGGQPADRGSIVFRPDNSAAEQTVRISDAHTENGRVVHFCDAEIPAGTIVRVLLDVDTRLDHAQQHTGEHIVSGLASKLFGAVNVGFHMAADYCTIDFDIPLEQAQLEELERAANAAVRANLSVHTEVTTPEDASTRTLRKKSDKAVGNDKNKKSDKHQNNICEPVLPAKAVRIVYIDNGKIDSCTCCGTHLAATGGVGTILFTDAQHYKGGTRLWFVCGGRATAAVRTVQNIGFRACKAVFNLTRGIARRNSQTGRRACIFKKRAARKKPPSCLCRERRSAFNGGTHKRHRRGMFRYGRLNRQRFKAHGGRAL